jgi:Flp pilus assembly pilin Flp
MFTADCCWAFPDFPPDFLLVSLRTPGGILMSFRRISTIDKHVRVGHYECVRLGFIPLIGNGMDWRVSMSEFIRRIWSEDAGQDIAEYAVMLAVILVLVVGTIRLIGSNANNAFSNVASAIQ